MKTLDGFRLLLPASLDRNRILSLAELAFIDRADVVHLLGPPGTGARRSSGRFSGSRAAGHRPGSFGSRCSTTAGPG